MARRSRYQNVADTVLTEAAGPLSAAELHEALSTTGVGLATVYRVINQGVESGRYAAVETPGGPTRYEPADRPHHHHFECLDCRRMFDVAGCPGGINKLLPEAFTLESHEILLRGRCADCAGAAA